MCLLWKPVCYDVVQGVTFELVCPGVRYADRRRKLESQHNAVPESAGNRMGSAILQKAWILLADPMSGSLENLRPPSPRSQGWAYKVWRGETLLACPVPAFTSASGAKW